LRSKPCIRLTWAVAAAMGVSLAAAARAGVAAAPEPQDGFWPTPRMVELVVERLIDDTALRFGLDGRQRALFRKRFEALVPSLLAKHRAVLEPLFADILLQHLSGEAPTSQKVAGWAKTGLPILREAMGRWDKVYQGMRPELRPEQRAKWAREHFVFKLGYGLAEAKLRSFAAGRFDPREWHTPLPGPYQPKDEILTQAERAGMNTRQPLDPFNRVIGGMGRRIVPPGPGASWSRRRFDRASEAYLPLDRWEAYTHQFIQRFELDQGQRTSAMAILKEMRQRARDYRKRHARELSRVRSSLRRAKGDERARLRDEFDELERPCRELFDEFRGRLDRLLSESQRALRGSGR